MDDTKILNWINTHCTGISTEQIKGDTYKVISWFDRANVHQFTYGSDLRDCVERACRGEARQGTNLFSQLPGDRVYRL